MIYLPALHVFSLLSYACLAVFLIARDAGSRLNRSCAVVLACFTLWSLGKTVAHHPAASLALAVFFRNIVIVGAWTFSSFLLVFALTLTGRFRLLNRKLFYVLLFAIPVTAIFVQWRNDSLLDYVRRPFGWGLEWKPSILTSVLLIHIFGTTVLSAALVIWHSVKIKDPAKKQQVRIVGLSILAGIGLGFVTNFLAPRLQIQLPDLAQDLALIWTFGMVYAIVRYDFLIVHPAMAADNIIAAMSDTLILADRNDRVVTINPAGKDLLANRADDWAGVHLRRLFFTKSAAGIQPVADADAMVAAGDDFLMKSAKGLVPVHLSISPLFSKEGSRAGTAVIARDISYQIQVTERLQQAHDLLECRVKERTEALEQTNKKLVAEIDDRIRVQEALIESEAKFKLISEQSLLGVVILQDNLIQYANSAWGDITGFSVEEMLGWPPGQFVSHVHPDDRRHLMEQAAKKQAGDPAVQSRYDWRLIKNDGSVRWIAMYSKTVQYNGRSADLATLIDITESKHYLLALEQSEEKYRVLVENANDAILIVQDEAIRFPNRRTIEMSGYNADELSRMSFVDLVHPQDQEMVRHRYAQRLKGEPLTSNKAFRILNKAGDTLWVQANAAKITWADHPAILSIVRDITVQNRIEAQLNHKIRLEAVGTLAGGIAHDFNNLLSPLLGHAEYLVEKLDPKSPLHEAAEQIFAASRRSRDLVKQILTFSQKAELRFEPVDVGAVVREAVGLSRSTIPESIQVVVDIDAVGQRVNADATRLHQVVVNLIINACHAMAGDTGRLTLSLKPVKPSDPQIKALELPAVSHICLSVADTGVGMDEETLDRIFEPYFTTRREDAGSGLGLSVAFGIVKSCGGAIDVHSAPGQGTRFDVVLPVSDTTASDIAPDVVESQSLEGVRVLVVDDDKAVALVICRMLERLKCTAVTAFGGQEAVDLYKAAEGGFDLLLTDMSLVMESGLALAERFKTMNDKLPVILMTGYSEESIADRVDPAIVDGRLFKPVERSQLEKVMRQVL